MQISIPPNFSTPWATAEATCSSNLISQTTGKAFPPTASISSAAV